MPMMDMSAALTNPFSVDTFSVSRRTQTVSTQGLAQTSTQSITGLYGVVYPSDESDLKLLPELQVQEKAITVITKYALRGESETTSAEFSPDLVVWNGDNFKVRHLEDFSQYAGGFIKAICTSVDRVDQPPTTE